MRDEIFLLAGIVIVGICVIPVLHAFLTHYRWDDLP